MNLSPDADQIELLSATTGWCQAHMPIGDARGRPANLQRDLRSMGWLEMTLPATRDGLGLSHATEALIFAELGRFLAPVSVIAAAIANRWRQPSDTASPAGFTSLAIPANELWRVFDPENAMEVLFAGARAIRLARQPEPVVPRESLDPLTPIAVLAPPEDARTLAPAAHSHLQLLSAACAIGCADAARDMAADYARVREQFDRPIGWFQAVKHMCADMAVRSAAARSQIYYAACALDADDSDATFHISAAKRLADQAALENARSNIQIHGGIGMTDAAAPHLFLKRAHLLAFVTPCRSIDLLGASE